MRRSERDRRARNCGLFVGIIAGIADAVAVLIENPASFAGWRSPAAFVGASLLLYIALGAFAGILFAAARRVVRVSDQALFAFGLAGGLFVWAAIRVHVHWYFGEPLTSAKSAPAYSGAALGAAFVAVFTARLLRRPLDRALDVRMKRPAFLVLVVAALLVVAGVARWPRKDRVAAAGAGLPDLLLVTLDTFRADHVSASGYPRGTTPALDRLARRGVQALLAASPIPLTNPSHVSMFTGLEPREHGVFNNGAAYRGETPTLAETLRARGYQTAAFVSGIPLKAGLSGLRRGFDAYDDSFSVFDRLHPMVTSLAALRAANRLIPTDLVERRAADTVNAARRWIRGSGPAAPRFVWVHLYDAHSPYDAPAVLQQRFARESDAWSARGKPVVEWPIADYDAELREVDRRLDDLVGEFENAPGDGRDGFVFVTADHGEGLEQHGELTHGQLLYEEDLRVPWIHANVRDGEATSASIDLTPRNLLGVRAWVLERVGLDEPIRDGAEGRNAADGWAAATYPPEGREAKASFLEIAPRATDPSGARREPGRKVIVNFANGEVLAYDLAADPGETRPLDSSGPEWESAKRGLAAPDSTGPTPIDPEVKRRLESLGYIH